MKHSKNKALLFHRSQPIIQKMFKFIAVFTLFFSLKAFGFACYSTSTASAQQTCVENLINQIIAGVKAEIAADFKRHLNHPAGGETTVAHTKAQRNQWKPKLEELKYFLEMKRLNTEPSATPINLSCPVDDSDDSAS